MAKPKRRASDSGDNDRQSKITKASQPKDTDLEQAPSEECFQVEVKLHSTSKAEFHDPKPPGYWEERYRALRASVERLDATEESANPLSQPISLKNDNIPNDSEVASG
jgi:hypothetical protein